MKHTVETISPSRRKIAVAVEKEIWKQAQEKAFKKLAQNIQVPGFRKGKAPESMVRARVNQEALYNEALRNVMDPVYADVLKEEKLIPFFAPRTEVTKLSDNELELVFNVVLFPEVKLGQYKGLKAKKEAPSVSDKDVDESIKRLLEQNANLVTVEGRAAKLGDTTIIDFDGYLKDENGALKQFDGGQANNYELVLGSNQFIPGFEDGVVGMKAGDKKDLVLKFPENYVKELAGKEATFKVTLHEIKEKQIPELNDEAVDDLLIKDVHTVQELKAHQKERLLKDKIARIEEEHYEAIVSQVVENATFIVDEAIYDNEAHNMDENLKKSVESNGLTMEQYFEITGTKQEDLHKQNLAQAENNIKRYLALEQVAREEKIVVTDEDLEKDLQELADKYSMKLEEVKHALKDNMDRERENVRAAKIRKVLLGEETKAEEKKAPAKKAAPKKEAAPNEEAEKKAPAKKPAAKKAPAKKAESK